MAVFELRGPDRVHTIKLTGRPAWLLFRLIEAGSGGLTTQDLPAGLRVSGYIHKLRKAGIDIGTRYEANAGAFGGSHGRYTLRSNVHQIAETAE